MIVKIIKKPDDPICTRASVGGDPGIGYYLVFRGDKTTVITCLEVVLRAIKDDAAVIVEEGD